MTHYTHILLAVDFSQNCGAVAAKARALADSYQAKLSIIHVLDNIAMPDTNYGTIIPLDSKSSYEALEAEKIKLRHISEQLAINPVNCWLVWGVPQQAIIQIAEQEQVDLIIVGSHGRHGLALLLGSTANGVLHHANCDVLAVRLQND